MQKQIDRQQAGLVRFTRTTTIRTRHVTFKLSFEAIDALVAIASAKNSTLVAAVEAAITEAHVKTLEEN